MSISLLLEKYDVSTEEGLQKALGEIEKEKCEVDEALAGALSRACNLEGRLRTASQAYSTLSEMRGDALAAADMVDKTALLARDVSAKVRQLDLARCRVAECQRRVHDLIDLQLCSAGVEAAIKAHDYETGAAHVARYLSMDPGSVAAARARGALDPRDDMARAADTLHTHIVRKFEEAARKEDETNIFKLVKLFPQIGRAEEGVDLLAKYLAGQLEVSVRAACTVEGAAAGRAVFADAATRVLEAGAAALRRAARQLGLLHRALPHLQPKVCSGMQRIYAMMVRVRKLGVEPEGSALEVEPTLTELALILHRISLYFNFIRKNTEADAANVDEAKKQLSVNETEKIISECELTRTSQDLLAHYLALERYFLEESVSKALKLSAPQPGDTATSLVDDVYFIVRKVISRSISSGCVEGTCAVVNEAGGALTRAAAALQARLRTPPPDPLPLAAPPPLTDAHHPPPPDALDRDLDAQRQLYLAQICEAEAGGEWGASIGAEAEAGAAPLCRGAQRDKLRACVAQLVSNAAAFTRAADHGMMALLAAIRPKLHIWADRLVSPKPLSPAALPAALEGLEASVRGRLPPPRADQLLAHVVTDIAHHAENRILAYKYDRESGIEVEVRMRRLASWAGGCGAGRERAARAARAAALLALDAPHHAHHALPLPAHLARDILARRIDFKIEDIKRLKL